MKRILSSFLLLTFLCLVSTTQADGESFSNKLNTFTLGNLDGQNGWSITKHDTEANGTVTITSLNQNPEDKFIEITNESSIFASRSNSPLNTGVIQFKARHNKSGLFYLYAQTSDNGGQLLFSIQFTETNGILLEESDKQIMLLPDYNQDQWYSFVINFDNTKGEQGTFTLTLDGEYLGEYEYVKSASETFDFAQITIGSESTGNTSISAFADSFPVTNDTATSTVSTDLLMLSITLSSTSISSNLDNGLIVTASLDGIASVATSSISEIATDTPTVEIPDTTSSIGSVIMDIIESVIDVFTSEETPSTELVPSVEITPPNQPETAPGTTETIPDEPNQTKTTPEPQVENISNESLTENAEQSSVPTNDNTNNETITSEF